MAIFSVTTETEEALTTSVETVLQLRGSANAHAQLIGFGISFDGTSASAEPVRVRLLRQTTDGTGTGATEVKWNGDSPAAAVTAFNTFSAEPTAGDVLLETHVHPQGGSWHMMFPLGERPVIDDASTSRIALDVLAPAAVNCCAYMIWNEG